MDTTKLNILALSDSGFIFDPSTGNSFNTNSVGMQIIKGYKSNLSQDEIAKNIEELFEGDIKEIYDDIGTFLQELKDYHLI